MCLKLGLVDRARSTFRCSSLALPCFRDRSQQLRLSSHVITGLAGTIRSVDEDQLPILLVVVPLATGRGAVVTTLEAGHQSFLQGDLSLLIRSIESRLGFLGGEGS